jgi:hypothetical protein
MQDISTPPVREHQADDGRCEKRADAPDPEKPADRGCPQAGGMQFPDINAGRSINARIDPTHGRGSEVEPLAARLRKPEVEERANEVVQEQNDASPEAIDEEPAGGISEEGRDRLHEHEGDGLRQRISHSAIENARNKLCWKCQQSFGPESDLTGGVLCVDIVR